MTHGEHFISILWLTLVIGDLKDDLISPSELIYSWNVFILRQRIVEISNIILAAEDHKLWVPPNILDNEILVDHFLGEKLS